MRVERKTHRGADQNDCFKNFIKLSWERHLLRVA
ncbi:hypothetical protein SAMN06298226_0069 [Nitrosovibrio sp. Nv4]|nr:hypothetical protein SAMN06298226_0069 [Nitrosovibrio sp. Nv4]